MSPWLESSDALFRHSWSVTKVNDVFNLKQAAAKVGISEGVLILWIATGKVKPGQVVQIIVQRGDKVIEVIANAPIPNKAR